MLPVWHGLGDLTHSLQYHIEKIAFFIPSNYGKPNLEIDWEPKKVKNTLFAILKIVKMIELWTNITKVVTIALPNYNQIDFAVHGYKLSIFCQHNSPSKSIFHTIWTIFSGHHTQYGMHASQMHSSIQHPNIYSSTIVQHNQSNTPVIMHPDNVFILSHLKMIQIFIWPCYMQTHSCQYVTSVKNMPRWCCGDFQAFLMMSKCFGLVHFETKSLGSFHCTQFWWTQKNGKLQKWKIENSYT